MQAYLEDKDLSRAYVISKSFTENEDESKRFFANVYYGIPNENIFFVRDDAQKIEVFMRIREKYPELPNYKIIMVEDTVKVLDAIKEKTGCATVHISSFLDL